jgi:accessory gene regulator protein AgrB
MTEPKPLVAFSPEDMKRRKKRSLYLALCLVGMIILFFVTTLVKLGAGITERIM